MIAEPSSHSPGCATRTICDSENYDEAFCRRIEQQIWAYAGPIAAWSNMMLQPPPPYLIEFMVAAAQHQPIADTFVSALEHPLRGAELMMSAENVAAFLKSHGWQGMPGMPMAA